MKNQFDFKFMGIAGAIVAIALLSAWAAMVLFRNLFPHLAAETFWDEFSSSSIAALVIIGINSHLLRKKLFHLLVQLTCPASAR